MSKEILREIQQILELQAGLLKNISVLVEKLSVNLENQAETGELRLIPIREAAEKLGIAESTLRRLIAQGEIKSRRVGGKVVVPESEIRRIVLGRE